MLIAAQVAPRLWECIEIFRCPLFRRGWSCTRTMNRGGGWRGANVHARMQGSPRPSTRCARIPPAPLRKRSGVQVAYAKSESGAAGSRDGSWRALLSHHLRHLQLECLIKNSELLAHRMILFGWMIHLSRCPRKVAHDSVAWPHRHLAAAPRLHPHLGLTVGVSAARTRLRSRRRVRGGRRRRAGTAPVQGRRNTGSVRLALAPNRCDDAGTRAGLRSRRG